jgi:hypothetical protein
MFDSVSTSGISISNKPYFLSLIDGAIWHPTIEIAKKHPISGRFLAVPITFETFATELPNFPLKSLSSALGFFSVILGISKPDPHLQYLGTSAWMAGTAACYAIASIFSPLYALVKASIIFVKFVYNPLNTAQKEAFKSDWRNYDHKLLHKSKQVEITLPDHNKRYYALPKDSSESVILIALSRKTRSRKRHHLTDDIKPTLIQPLSEEEIKEGFFIPVRRQAAIGPHPVKQRFDLNAKCFSNDEILGIHPMKILPNSPFVYNLDEFKKEWQDKGLDIEEEIKKNDAIIKKFHQERGIDLEKETEKAEKAISITREGKHVILQQALRSCVPTCVGMLVLDHGKIPNYFDIANADLANEQLAEMWFKEAGLASKCSYLDRKKTTLVQSLNNHGPGILSINHPDVGGHVIILDEISIQKQTATIRDPFHGWMITVRLQSLLKYAGGYFLQVIGEKQ